jgi:hypothetical protein
VELRVAMREAPTAKWSKKKQELKLTLAVAAGAATSSTVQPPPAPPPALPPAPPRAPPPAPPRAPPRAQPPTPPPVPRQDEPTSAKALRATATPLPHASPPASAPPPESEPAGEPVGEWPLRMRERPSLGRFVVASRALAAGELVCSEEPFVQTVDDGIAGHACHLCYAVVDASAPPSCSRCAQVRFCSAACAADGAAMHAAECDVLCALSQRGGAAAAKGVRGLRLFIRLLHRCAADPSGLRAVEALQEHYTDAPTERRAFWDGMAAQINRLVPPALRLEPARLARLVSRVHTNLHAVSDMAGVQFGSGLYPRTASLLNHSCAPSAVVSFRGRTWRLHTLRALAAGEEVSIAYTELYAGRAERQADLLAKKAFECRCERCAAPPPSDTVLDGWRCVAPACDGVVAHEAAGCSACAKPHPLVPAARHAVEKRWRESIDQATAGLLSSGGGASGGPGSGAIDRALSAVDALLSQTASKVCDGHVARHKARRLRVYALNAMPSALLQQGARAAERVDALEACLEGMGAHLPHGHPETAFFRHWLAKSLGQQAGAERDRARRAHLQRRARDEARAAADALALAYGSDHPSVATWRAGDVTVVTSAVL